MRHRRPPPIAHTIARHAAPLLLLALSPDDVVPYLVLTLFDLGIGYAGQQLHHPVMASRHAIECAQDATERWLARLQLPMILALTGVLFVATIALFLLPWLLSGHLVQVWASLRNEGGWMLLVAAAISWSAAQQLDRSVQTNQPSRQASRADYLLGQARALDHLAVLGLFTIVAGYALTAIGPAWGLWLLAVTLTTAQCALDLGWRPAPQRSAG